MVAGVQVQRASRLGFAVYVVPMMNSSDIVQVHSNCSLYSPRQREIGLHSLPDKIRPRVYCLRCVAAYWYIWIVAHGAENLRTLEDNNGRASKF